MKSLAPLGEQIYSPAAADMTPRKKFVFSGWTGWARHCQRRDKRQDRDSSYDLISEIPPARVTGRLPSLIQVLSDRAAAWYGV